MRLHTSNPGYDIDDASCPLKNNCCRRQHTILHQSVSGSRIICSQEVNFGMFVHTER